MTRSGVVPGLRVLPVLVRPEHLLHDIGSDFPAPHVLEALRRGRNRLIGARGLHP